MERNITISNNGNTTLNISRSYTDNQYFEIIGDTLFTIQPNSSRSVTIRFNSVVKGNYNSKLYINSNDPDTPLLTVDLISIAFAVNEVHLNNSSGRSGHPVSISFRINNMENFVGFQFDLVLPNVLTYIQDSISLSNRAVDHSISANYIGNNRLRVIAFSPSNTPFSGSDGIIGNIKFLLNGIGGNYNISLDSVYITDSSAENVVSAYYNGSVNIASPDINGTTQINMGEVSVIDTLTTNYVLNNNGNDTLTVTSVSSPQSYFWSDAQLPLTIPPGDSSNFNILFSNNANGTYSDKFIIRSNDPDEDPFYVNVNASSYAPNYLLVRDTSGTVGDTVTLKLDINNYESFVAFQTDLVLPANLTYIPNTAQLTSRGANHSLSAGYLNNTTNTLRIFSFSLNQAAFLGNNGTVVELKCSADNQLGSFPLILQNSIISNANSENIIRGAVNGSILIHNPPPETVSLSSPVNNSTGLTQPIILKWQSSLYAVSYKLQVSTDITFATTILDTSGITDTTLTLSNLSNLTRYYWRVKAVNVGGESVWSDVWNFKTLGNPTTASPLLPADNAINQPIDLDFVWSKAQDQLKPEIGGEFVNNNRSYIKTLHKGRKKGNGIQTVSNYWFELSSDTTQSSFVIDSTLADTTKHMSGLTNLTTYYWKIRAKNETGWGNYSAWSKFTTIIDTPNVVALQSPSNNSLGNLKPVTVKWNSSATAESYQLQLSTDANFTTTLIDTSGITDTNFVLTGLSDLTKYYWRVNSTNTGGTSSWSEVWNFKTLGEPTTVTQLYPSSDAVNIPISLTFSWSKAQDQLRPEIGGTNELLQIKGITKGSKTNSITNIKGSKKGNGITTVGSYWFELTMDVASPPQIIDSTIADTTKQVSGLLNLTDYWWRVRAKNEVGWGNFTSWSKFTTVVDTSAVVQLLLPENNSTGNVQPINFVWNSSNLASGYKLQVSTDVNFATTVLDTSSLTDTTFVLSALNNLIKYYWRVKTVNVGGESSWSDIWNFKTLGEPTSVSLISPIDNAENQPLEIQFVWSKAVDQFGALHSEEGSNNAMNTIKIKKGIRKKGNVIATVSNYWLQLTKDINSTDFITNDSLLADTTSTISGLENATEYFWRVSAKNETGWNSFSDWFFFSTIVDLPGVVTLISPVDSLEYDSTMTHPEFLWNSDPLAANYELQMSYQANFDNQFFIKDSIADTLFTPDVEFGGDFYWRIQCSNIAGQGEWSLANFVKLIITGVEDNFNEIPKSYSLSYNYPNPFNPSTVIEYNLPKSSYVKLDIYDVVGNKVGSLVNKTQNAGHYQITFDASQLSSGVYFYRLSTNSGANNFTSVKKMILLR